MTHLDNHGEAVRLVEHLDGQVNTLLRENEKLKAALEWIVGTTHRPNPTDHTRIDVAPGQHRHFQAGVEHALKLLGQKQEAAPRAE